MAIFNCSRRMVLLSMILYLQHTKAQSGPCLYKAPILQTCSGQHLTTQYINVYHTNLQNLTHSTTCRCTVTANHGDTIEIQLTNVPGIIGCGTNVSIFVPGGLIIPIHCRNRLGRVLATHLRANDTVSLVVSTVAYSTSAPFCMYITCIGSGVMNVECSLSSTHTTATEITIPTLSLESKGASTSKTDGISTTKTDEMPTTFKTDIISTNSKTDAISTTILLSRSATVAIVMAAVLGVTVLVLLIIVTILCRRLRKQSNDKEEQTVQYADVQFPTPLPVYEQLAAGNRDERRDNTHYESLQNS